MTRSSSSRSLVGDEGGIPSLIGADSPEKRSPNILFVVTIEPGFSLIGVMLVLKLDVHAARDFARECRMDRDLVNAAAAV